MNRGDAPPAQEGLAKLREIAFLHIGKNAGTQIMHLAQQLKPHGVMVHQLTHEKIVRGPCGC